MCVGLEVLAFSTTHARDKADTQAKLTVRLCTGPCHCPSYTPSPQHCTLPIHQQHYLLVACLMIRVCRSAERHHSSLKHLQHSTRLDGHHVAGEVKVDKAREGGGRQRDVGGARAVTCM